MAKRLSTDYVHASLQLTETEMNSFITRLTDSSLQVNVMVYDNGNQEIGLYEQDSEEQILLPFEKKQNEYVVSDYSFRLKSFRLAEVFRQALIKYKGEADVHRIYGSSTIIYEYRNGKVMRITERIGKRIRKIYENKNWYGELRKMLMKQDVEKQIEHVRQKIDQLLDQRRKAVKTKQKSAIDEELRSRVKQLFILEP